MLMSRDCLAGLLFKDFRVSIVCRLLIKMSQSSYIALISKPSIFSSLNKYEFLYCILGS
uniref:Uncharacterized protein n=1 Tax=Lepeophtheirus salmonis TaxID=72036 RepID=A0A0K2T910_LEPSM